MTNMSYKNRTNTKLMHTAWGYPQDIPIHNRRKINLRLRRVNENCEETFDSFHVKVL